MKTVDILGVPIAAVNLEEAAGQIELWIRMGAKAYVTVTGVHGIMESHYDKHIKHVHCGAGMCVPDGMPAVWIGRLYNHKNMGRVYGPDFMIEVLRRSEENGYSNFFYGGKKGVPEILIKRLVKTFPKLRIAGIYSPPFRPLNENEETELCKEFERLAPDITWVGLSTPKQEMWMATNIKKLNTKIMIGVGAAFDFHAGLLKQAPRWVQQSGLEWLFRLYVEPRRLWKRYLVNNPLFIWNLMLQMLKIRKFNQREIK